MWRFLLPAMGSMAALLVLFAGAFGDLKSLSGLSDWATAIIDGTQPRHGPPPAAQAAQVAPAPLPEQQAARAALQRQITDLQRQAADLRNQIEQKSHDIDARRAEADVLHQGLEAMRAETETLRRQRQAEEDALSHATAQDKPSTTATAPRRLPAPRAASPQPAPAAAGPSAAQQLVNAQRSLAAGRPDEARQILAMAQTQMVLRPVTPDHPLAEGGNPSATDIGAAIRWLDIGAEGQAMQAINRAINRADAAEAWRGE